MAKTANIGRLSVSLEANTSKYSQKLKNASKTTKKETDKIGNSFTKSGKMAKGGIAALAVAAALAVNEAKRLAQEYVAAEKELRGFADAAGISTKELKAHAYALSSAGLSAEKIGDIYKDVSDKIGEFAAAGSGAFQDFIDVMKLTQQEGQALAKELQYMSGDEVLAYMAKEMDNAKVSASQMTFVLESMGSDASKAAKLLGENAEATRLLREEFALLSREADQINITAFEEANKQTDLFFSNLGALATDALGPVMESYAELVKGINKLLPESAKSKNKNFGSSTREELEAQYKSLSVSERNAKVKEKLEMKIAEITYQKIAAENRAAKAQLAIDEERAKIAAEQLKSRAGGAQSKTQGFAYHSSAATRKSSEQQIQTSNFDKAQSDIDNFNAQLESLQAEINQISSTSEKMVSDNLRTETDAVRKLEKLYVGLGKDKVSQLEMQKQAAIQAFEDEWKLKAGNTAIYAEKLFALELDWDKKISAEKLNNLTASLDEQRKISLEAAQKTSDALRAQEEKARQEKERLDAARAIEKAKLELQAMTLQDDPVALLRNEHAQEIMELQNQYANKIELKKEFDAAMLALEEKHAQEVAEAKKNAIDNQMLVSQEQASFTSSLFNDLGSVISSFGEGQSEAANKAFAVAKAAAVAQAVLNSFMAASQVWADPKSTYYEKIAQAASVAATTAGIVANIKSTQGPQGQAHDGIDDVPNEGTWILQKGERVIQPEANKDLTAFLNQKRADSIHQGGNLTVEAPMIVKGNVTDQTWFKAELVKHREIVAAAVKKVQKERPLRG